MTMDCSPLYFIAGIPDATVDTHWSLVTKQLAQGLADNWSQVSGNEGFSQ